MIRSRLVAIAIAVPTLISACGSQPSGHEGGPPHHEMPPALGTVADWANGAQLFDGLGDFHRAVSTTSPEAQRYFDQGMRLLWAFNHDEATRSFAEAARLDPGCGMCFWGVALTVGPNYNMAMMAQSRATVAVEALRNAERDAAKGTPVEQALIGALAKRYPSAAPLDPANEGPVLSAYAAAMKDVAARFPDDADVQVLYAESMMNLNPWKLWTADGKPAPGTEDIVATLQSVLKRDPMHPGANHYFIHAMEASPHPEIAVPSAERLRGMMPAAGHLQHMPAHIMQRVGRYEDAAEANREGAKADVDYFAKAKPLDYYAMYTAHNYQFLAFSTAMEGRRAETMDAVGKARDTIPTEMLLGMPGVDWSMTQSYAAKVRFGMWDAMVAEPAPDARLPGLTGGYLYAKAVAQAATGRVDEAKATVGELEKLSNATPADVPAGFNTARDMFAIGGLVAKARIAAAEGRSAEALAMLRDAVAKEDLTAYDEPADWFFPVRHVLGAELLKAGNAAEAEAVYRKDLDRDPHNGWALYGLAQALRAQQKTAEAGEIDRQFQQAWSKADVTLTASAF
jgi:tetratricopeptide (TPR) repeat protein